MGRFTNPRDIYFGEGARHEVKNLKGHKAIVVSGVAACAPEVFYRMSRRILSMRDSRSSYSKALSLTPQSIR